MNYAGIAIVVFAGCTSFDPIERGVCGNGLLEPGEDCDSNDPSCVACQVACRAASDCPTTAYACGVDGFCHAPSGAVSPATAASPLLATDVRISDIDGDGIGDVLALSNTSVVVRFGDAHAALTSSYTIATPDQTATPAIADLDGDGRLDVAIAAADGLVELASPYGTPSPQISRIPLADPMGNTFSAEAMWRIDDTVVGALLSDGEGPMEIAVLDFTPSGLVMTAATLCDASRDATDFSIADLDVYDASATDVVVSVPTGSGATRVACVVAIHTSGTTATFTDITPTGAAPQRKLVFADLDFDTDPCPSLIDSDAGGAGLRVWDGSMTGGHCTLATTTTTLPTGDDDPSTVAVGRIPLQPGIAFAGNDALVLSTGIDLYIAGLPPTLAPVFSSERRLDGVVSGDLDNDGNVDAVLSAEGEDGLDVVYRVVDGWTPGFIVARLETAGIVTAMAIGDFDGNGVNDVAFTEHLLDHDRLSVAYDTPGRTQTTIAQGTLDRAVSLVSFQLQDSTDPVGVVGDLIVLDQQQGVSTPQAVSIVEGSPDRTMLAYFDPRPSGDPPPHYAYRGVVAGDFVASTGTSQYPDVLAFAPVASATGDLPIKMFRLDGTAAGLDPNDPLDHDDGVAIAGVTYCSNDPAAGGPCLDDAVLIAWPTATNHDVVIGVDRESPPRAFVIDPWSTAPSATAAPAVTAGVPAGANIRSLRAVDLDGDGTPELVVAFSPSADAAASDPGLVLACTVAANGVPSTCSDLGAVVAGVLPGATCSDAAPGTVAFRDPTTPASVGTSLIALCHDATGDGALVRIDSSAGSYSATEIASGLGSLRAVEVGDVTGDGVDDIVALQGDAGSRSITVLAQCSSRDLACQQTAVQP